MIDIIPDIHGQAEKLETLLRRLGWRRTTAGWSATEPDREIVFLGDFIDRGPDNSGVLRIVRSLHDAGKARAVMGNHELNALHYHTIHPDTGAPLRARSRKNTAQHAAFLKDFPLGAPETACQLGWMRTLPLFLETHAFRAVHACWHAPTIETLRAATGTGVLDEEQLVEAGTLGTLLKKAVDTTAKGPEAALPEGFAFHDKASYRRTDVRLSWWKTDAATWVDTAISVPDPSELPDAVLPEDVRDIGYPAEARPVFFGHYWLSGEVVLQAPNALCLDYSAGADGPLLAYCHASTDAGLSLDRTVSSASEPAT